MARKKSVLGLDRMDLGFGIETTGLDFPAGGDLSVRNESKQLHGVSATHEVAMRLLAKKIFQALQTEADLHKFANLKFLEALRTTSLDLEQTKGTEYERVMVEFTNHSRESLAHQLLGSLNVGGKALIQQAMIPPYPEPEPVEQVELRGFIKWLLFKNG